MTVKKAYQLQAGDVIGEIVARVVKIEPPRKQTPAQERAGIHNQSIFLQDPDGTEIRMVLIKPSLHMPMTDAGARFHFRSMNNDKGRMEGIFRKEWRKDSGEVDHYLEANDCCRFYMIKDEPNTKANPERSTTGSHVRESDGPLTMHNVAEFYCDIVATLETRLNGSALWDALVRDPAPLMSSASSIFIECNKRGVMDRHIKHAPTTPQYEREEAPRTITPPPAEPDMTPASEPLETLAVRDSIDGKDIRDLREGYSLAWEKVYDGLVEHLRKKGYESAAIDAAYDHIRKLLTRNGAERRSQGDIEYQIASEFDLFQGHVAKAQEILNQTRQRQAELQGSPQPQPEPSPPSDSDPNEDWNPADTFAEEP